MNLPDIPGLEVLAGLRESRPEPGIIIVTAFGTIRNAVEAMKLGAYDYLDEARRQRRAPARHRAHPRGPRASATEVEAPALGADLALPVLEHRRDLRPDERGLPAASEKISRGRRHRADHRRERHRQGARRPGHPLRQPAQGRARSSRSTAARSPRDLLESELFGHVKGAFTGARSASKTGKFEQADGGTIFLDEVGDIAAGRSRSSCCASSQEREIDAGRRDADACRVDVRVIAATNQDLEGEVAGRQLPRGPLLPARRRVRSRCRRCASGARTSRRWSSTSSPQVRRRARQERARGFTPGRAAPLCRATPGRGTSANSRTSSTKPWSWPRASG
ncbi:MAG: sigma 54-interacting transcriptional regulator [Marinilabiliales bacterium]|nr:sigma 54-interacting transcriptional regulator [Marinilabiliales bacterium]